FGFSSCVLSSVRSASKLIKHVRDLVDRFLGCYNFWYQSGSFLMSLRIELKYFEVYFEPRRKSCEKVLPLVKTCVGMHDGLIAYIV
ncbi:hypothetical protein PIB30_099632, partial [Stylosanthes scabra]|nr:hypothetical protein [Stylosanthes scabra]